MIHKKIIQALASYIPFSFLKKKSINNIIFPFYHSVSNEYLPHIANLYKVKTIKQFENDLDFLLKNYEPTDIYSISKNNNSKKNKFLLSFDDGLSQSINIIAPILLKKGIPAIFFINPNFIDNNELFYKFKISIIIDEISKNKEKFKIIQDLFYSEKNITNFLKKIDISNNNILDKIASYININFNDFLRIQKPYLNSNQIQLLQNQGFTIGAHSLNHPDFEKITIEQQIFQTKESIDFVHNNFHEKLKLFAFPFSDYGVKKTFFEKIYAQNIADFTFGTAGMKIDEFENNFQRIPMENSLSAKKYLKFELLYFALKKIINKNKITRL